MIRHFELTIAGFTTHSRIAFEMGSAADDAAANEVMMNNLGQHLNSPPAEKGRGR